MHNLVYFYPEGHSAHAEAHHPERPERVEALVQGLDAAGWWQSYPHLAPETLPAEFLQRVHHAAYLEALESVVRSSARLDADTYTTPDSLRLALNAAGGSAAVARAVWNAEARRGFALARPPGHHATMHRGMGFCLLNNIALSAEYLLAHPQPGGNPQRLAIIDLDVHHGNGTQDIFWNRGDVMFISVHQSPLYPGSGALHEIGAGEGRGYTANFPLPPYSGDVAFATLLEQLILPLLDRCAPQMLLVSVGFDTHWLDPLGGLLLSAGQYGRLIEKLAAWADSNCQGKIALFLEGGYDLEVGKICAQAVVAALLGIPWNDPLNPPRNPEETGWRNMLSAARRLWKV